MVKLTLNIWTGATGVFLNLLNMDIDSSGGICAVADWMLGAGPGLPLGELTTSVYAHRI